MFSAGVGAAATGISVLGANAVKSYAETEQLIGGIETLFGTGGLGIEKYAEDAGKAVSEIEDEYNMLMDAQITALNNAQDAYKTAGMSANEYMGVVTGFAASLKQSTKNELEAAEIANQTVIDMADNANKMGTNMESIQNAYQGFAKQNYTMLDNLKLGYGGTKEEMKRLLADAEKLTGIKYDINNLSDVYNAIHVIQTELGITGTTAKEAASTISGSFSMMQSAWSNLLSGMLDEDLDFDGLIDDFVESAEIFGKNILPKVEDAIEGIGELVESLLPVIVARIPFIIEEILPDLVQSGTNMLIAIINGITENFPVLVETAEQITGIILEGITDICPAIEPVTNALQFLIENFDAVLAIIVPLTAAFVAWHAAVAIANTVDKLTKATKGMTAAQIAAEAAQKLLNLTMLANPFVLITTLLAGLVTAIVYLWNTNEDFRRFWINAWNSICTFFTSAWNDIKTFLTKTIPQLISDLCNWFSELPDKIWEWLKKTYDKFVEFGSDLWEEAKTIGADVVDGLIGCFGGLVDSFTEIGSNIISGIWNGISSGWDWLVGKVQELASSLFNAAKKKLDINSPSRKFKWLGEMCVAGFDEGTEDLMEPQDMTKNISASLSAMEMKIKGATFTNTGNTSSFNQTININQPISTPDELARAVRVESRYGLMKGVAYG